MMKKNNSRGLFQIKASIILILLAKQLKPINHYFKRLYFVLYPSGLIQGE